MITKFDKASLIIIKIALVLFILAILLLPAMLILAPKQYDYYLSSGMTGVSNSCERSSMTCIDRDTGITFRVESFNEHRSDK